MKNLQLFIVLFFMGAILNGQNARLQVIHNSPSPTVDIWVNDQPFYTNFAFREATPFVTVPAGVDLNIGVAPSPSNSPADIIATFTVNLVDGETYLVVANGIVGDTITPFGLDIFAGGRESATNSEGVDVLVFHGSPDAPNVDIGVREFGVNVVTDLAFSEFAGYLELPEAVDVVLDIKPAGTEDVVASYFAPLTVLAGQATTVFASGFLGDQPGFGLFAALADGSVIELPAYAPTARLQVIHNSPSPTVDIWVNDQPFYTNFAFREATPFVTVPAGVDLNIGVAPSPSNSPADIIATFTVNLVDGETYVVVANGIVGDPVTPFGLEIFAGGRESATNTEGVDVLVFHGSPEAPNVDIGVREFGVNVVTDLAFSEFAGYLELPEAVDVVLDIKPAGTEDVVASYFAPLTVLAGQATTVFASGFLGDQPGFGLFAALADGSVIELPAYAPTARLQVIHNSPSPTLDIWVNDQPFYTNFAFREATPFVTVSAGVDLNIGVAPSPSNSPADIITTFTVNLVDGETYVVVANGIVGDPVSPFGLDIFTGGRESATNTEGVDVLVFHGSPDAPNVDIGVREFGVNVVTDLAFSEFAGYLELPEAVDVILDIKPAGTEDVVASYFAPLSLLQGQAFTVFASGLLGDEPSFGLYVAMADGVVIPLSTFTSIIVPVFEDIAVFPNPAAEQFQIRFKSQTTMSGTSRMYDVTGRQVFSNPVMFQEGENLLNFPVQQLSRGQYILELMKDDGTSMRFPVIKN